MLPRIAEVLKREFRVCYGPNRHLVVMRKLGSRAFWSNPTLYTDLHSRLSSETLKDATYCETQAALKQRRTSATLFGV